MASFLKIVSGLYLILVWLIFAVTANAFAPLGVYMSNGGSLTLTPLSFLIAVSLSIPAVALFGFGQIIGDVRIMRRNAELQSDQLEAIRRYYEPQR